MHFIPIGLILVKRIWDSTNPHSVIHIFCDTVAPHYIMHDGKHLKKHDWKKKNKNGENPQIFCLSKIKNGDFYYCYIYLDIYFLKAKSN